MYSKSSKAHITTLKRYIKSDELKLQLNSLQHLKIAGFLLLQPCWFQQSI